MLAFFFEGKAFAGTNDFPLGKQSVGNPALICYTESLLPADVMAAIAKQSVAPNSIFLSAASDNDATDFHIRFFNPGGTESDLCGHGTLVATYFVRNFIADGPDFTFRPNPVFRTGQSILKGTANDHGIAISMPVYGSHPYKATSVTDKIIEAMGLSTNEVALIHETDLKDYIFTLHNHEALRKIKPDFDAIIRVSRHSFSHRVLTVTAPTTEDGFDYESRVFIPMLGINEDIACGSANCSLAPVWGKRLNKSNVKMFYCSPDDEGNAVIGGIQNITIEKNQVLISSNVLPAWTRCIHYDSPKNLLEKALYKAMLRKVTPTLYPPSSESTGFEFVKSDAPSEESPSLTACG